MGRGVGRPLTDPTHSLYPLPFVSFASLMDELIRLCHWMPPNGRNIKSMSARQECATLLAQLPNCGVGRGQVGG